MAALAGPLVLVGCGKMGSALLQGWLAHGLATSDALVVEPAPALREQVRASHGVAAVAECKALPQDLQPQALVFAVKPQMMATVLPAYRQLAGSGAVVVSIAAGTAMAIASRVAPAIDSGIRSRWERAPQARSSSPHTKYIPTKIRRR